MSDFNNASLAPLLRFTRQSSVYDVYKTEPVRLKYPKTVRLANTFVLSDKPGNSEGKHIVLQHGWPSTLTCLNLQKLVKEQESALSLLKTNHATAMTVDYEQNGRLNARGGR